MTQEPLSQITRKPNFKKKETKSKTVTLIITPTLYNKIIDVAENKGEHSLNSYITKILESAHQ